MTDTTLTANQQILVRHVCTAPSASDATTESLAMLLNEKGTPFGENAVRNAMTRLEAAGLVRGDGKGRARQFDPTPAGRRAVGLGPDSNPEAASRGYVVLEELPLEAALMDRLPDGYSLVEHSAGDLIAELGAMLVYLNVNQVTARNTDHAYRQTAKEIYPDCDGDPTLVAVAEKQWRPTVVRINTRRTVSVG